MASSMNLPVERKSEYMGIVVLALTGLLFLALVSDGYQVRDQVTRPFDEILSVSNGLGAPGALVAGIFAILVGDARHVTYSLTFIWALMLISRHPLGHLLPRMLGAGLAIVAVAGFLQLNFRAGTSNIYPGGAIGAFVVDKLNYYHFGYAGSNVIICSLILVGLLLATEYMFLYLYVVVRHVSVFAYRTFVMVREARARAALESPATQLPKSRRVGRIPRQESLPLVEAAPAPLGYESTDPGFDEEEEVEPVAVPTPDRHARINVRVAPEVPVAVDDEAPFDAVPDITDDGYDDEEDEVFAGESLAFDLDPLEDDVVAPDSTDDEYGYEEEETEDSAPFDLEEEEEAEEEAPVVLAPPARVARAAAATPAATESAAPAPKVRRPRRKVVENEELPPGYEYPRHYTRPPMDLLDEPEERVVENLAETLRATSILLEDTLQTFGIEARVTDVTRGPTITRYELEPAPGIKVARFLALADDIALALKAHRIRVEAPIPGKGRVGIEAPNTERDQVLIRELLESQGFKRGKGKLNLVLGKDITGEVKIADLATMPHLLVAGATGAGKTVCVKALLASLLFKHTPDDLQLILIDPKMVELSIFNDIPHLITPVVIDPKKASLALTWLINEMEERYRLFADLRVRNIEVYNQSVENGEIELDGDEDDNDAQSLHIVRRLPYIVCVIDELADLMMLARSEVEDCIARLAQLARAVGIHLIIATQRPSVDVLTGVIKANFPSRISFQVSSRVDSRCILDEIGAERLIGMGDMLYLPAGQSKPTRIQGAFVSDEEMNGLINYLKRQAPPQYKDEIENFGKSKEKADDITDEPDDLFEDAVQVVMDTGQASISMVQRRLRVGYTRAARLIDMMERKGIVGPHTGSKAREILVDAVHIEESS
ncbi:MAG: DNA translocase FtsK 4TM domain-containing protein [Candidatus Hydrogenedentes bacterium]|nr:DNA translocase FtsK 4TM domain-containing protein [Candidatus Hydrogenedentota bacterium]